MNEKQTETLKYQGTPKYPTDDSFESTPISQNIISTAIHTGALKCV